MIQANELRIGNWISRKRNDVYYHFTVYAETFSDIENGDIAPYGIPLTPEILEKCGFEKSKDRKENDIYTLLGEETKFSITKLGAGFWHEAAQPTIQYVHQLQNLFWCLCQKELTIKF